MLIYIAGDQEGKGSSQKLQVTIFREEMGPHASTVITTKWKYYRFRVQSGVMDHTHCGCGDGVLLVPFDNRELGIDGGKRRSFLKRGEVLFP